VPRQRKCSAQSVAVLSALVSLPRTWQHGYELSKITGLPSGTLYPILGRLDDRGYLESKWLESTEAGRPPRHVYRLTSRGSAYAREVLDHRADGRVTTSPFYAKA
jgi:PadR family transcriptional regulator PadR